MTRRRKLDKFDEQVILGVAAWAKRKKIERGWQTKLAEIFGVTRQCICNFLAKHRKVRK